LVGSGLPRALSSSETSRPGSHAQSASLRLLCPRPAAMSSPEKTYSKADNPFGLEEGEVPTIEDVAQLIGDGKAKRILIMVSRAGQPNVPIARLGLTVVVELIGRCRYQYCGRNVSPPLSPLSLPPWAQLELTPRLILARLPSPDFRSPETGLYANLQKYDLPCPEDIFDIEYLVVSLAGPPRSAPRLRRRTLPSRALRITRLTTVRLGAAGEAASVLHARQGAVSGQLQADPDALLVQAPGRQGLAQGCVRRRALRARREAEHVTDPPLWMPADSRKTSTRSSASLGSTRSM
jgi:hypothetical protein